MALDRRAEVEQAAAAVAGPNGAVEVKPIQDALVERGEGLIKQELTRYVKTPETNQENKNAITVQPGHIPGSSPGNDNSIRANRNRDRKPVDDGVAKEGRESSGSGYIRGSVSVPAFAGTGRDGKSVQPEPSRATGDHGNVGPESRAAGDVESVSIADAALGHRENLPNFPGARPLVKSLIKRRAPPRDRYPFRETSGVDSAINSQGLEFRAVAMMACDEGIISLQEHRDGWQ